MSMPLSGISSHAPSPAMAMLGELSNPRYDWPLSCSNLPIPLVPSNTRGSSRGSACCPALSCHITFYVVYLASRPYPLLC